jgi:hypothetical protein
MDDDAGERMGAVGGLGALVGGQRNGKVAVARGGNGEVCRCERSAETLCEGERDVFFRDVVAQGRACLRTTVCGVKEDNGAGGL